MEETKVRKGEQVMAERKRGARIQNLVCAAAGPAAAAAVWLRHGGTGTVRTARGAVSAACDAAFLAGMVCCLVSLFDLCRVSGAFGLMRYGFGSLLGIFHRGDAAREKKYADFAAWLAHGKRGERSRKTPLLFAAGWFALGACFLLAWYRAF